MRSYRDTVDYIANLRGGEIDLKLDRVRQALVLFDNPQNRYLSFHVAGTNGKGSTAAIVHQILSCQGYRTGLYTSPHLVSFTERIRVGDEEISADEVIELAALVQRRLEGQGLQLTFFEFVTVMGLVYFAEKKIAAAVVEVGLGGRLDATNVVLPVVSLITTISRDHEAYLGNDLLSIAREKGGIIKQGVPVVCGRLSAAVRALYQEFAATRRAPAYFFAEHFGVAVKDEKRFDYHGRAWSFKDLQLALPGSFQRNNAAVALAALEVGGQYFPVAEAAVRKGLESVVWPARMETVRQQPQVILDGAHNDEGTMTLVAEIEGLRKNRRIRLLFGALQDKDWRLMLEHLCALAHEVVLTRVPAARGVEPAVLAGAIPAEIPCHVIENPCQALEFLLRRAGRDDLILVTGSLYLMGEVRPFFTREKNVELPLADTRV